MNKIKSYIPKLFLWFLAFWSVVFPILITGSINYFNFIEFYNFLFIAGVVITEAIFFVFISDKLQTKLPSIEEFKKRPDSNKLVLKMIYYIESVQNKLLLFIVYPICFILISLILGTVLTTILFRKNGPYSGFLYHKTLLYFISSCTVSIVAKYFGFVTLLKILWNFVKKIYLQVA
jgi:hypothetical protein